MPPIVELIVVVVTMIGAFFLIFMLMFLLALCLYPVERSLSKMIWEMTEPARQKAAFKDFSKKRPGTGN
jgi:hypothetical protein